MNYNHPSFIPLNGSAGPTERQVYIALIYVEQYYSSDANTSIARSYYDAGDYVNSKTYIRNVWNNVT
jgi:hypothetical protein